MSKINIVLKSKFMIHDSRLKTAAKLAGTQISIFFE